MKKIKSIRVKILAGVIIPLVLASIVFGIVLTYITTTLIQDHVVPQYEKSLELMLEKYSSLVDEDLVEDAKRRGKCL